MYKFLGFRLPLPAPYSVSKIQNYTTCCILSFVVFVYYPSEPDDNQMCSLLVVSQYFVGCVNFLILDTMYHSLFILKCLDHEFLVVTKWSIWLVFIKFYNLLIQNIHNADYVRILRNVTKE